MASIEVDGGEVDAFRRLVHAKFGIVLPPDAESFLRSRLLGHVRSAGYRSLPALLRGALDDSGGELLLEVVEQVATNHSYFYREPAHFEFLVSTVLPQIDAELARRRSSDVRIWSAAAAAGEEAYSIVMAMRSYFGARYDTLDAGVLATDIALHALRRGAAGEFKEDAFRHLPAEWRRTFVEPAEDGRARVIKPVRDEVLFRWLNLIEPLTALKGGYHVIFCRNVMIYFDSETRRTLIRSLADLLAPGGYLFIGHTDNPDHARRYLDQMQPAIFRKRGGA